jgi:hypothetical protein
MVDSTVAAMTPASVLDGTELYYGVQAAADRKVTGSQIKTLANTAPAITGTTTITGTQGTLTVNENNTNGANPSFQQSISTDYSAWSGPSIRPNLISTTLSPASNTGNIWENFYSIVTFAGPGQSTAEINTIHGQFTMNSGQTSTGTVESMEARGDNSGTLNAYVNYLGLTNNTATGTATTFQCLKNSLVNANTTAGAIGTYTMIDMEAMTGAGSLPTNYFFLRNAESNAVSVTTGNLGIGSLAIPVQRLSIVGTDTSSATQSVKVADSAANLLFSVANNGDVIASNTIALGLAGSKWGKVLFKNTTSGTLQLNPPSAGALTGILTLPNATANVATSNSSSKTASYTVLTTDLGTAFTNNGAAGAVIFTLPAAAIGLYYRFTCFVAQTLEVLCVGSDKIAVGTTNSAAAGNAQVATPFASLSIRCDVTGQWVATSSTGTWTVT